MSTPQEARRNAEEKPRTGERPPNEEPEEAETGDGKKSIVPKASWLSYLENKNIRITVMAIAGALVLMVGLCSIPAGIDKLTPEPVPTPEPTAKPTPLPTWTPEPAWTPEPTGTLLPITTLPDQQEHYQEYRIYHMIYEYGACYNSVIEPPEPTKVPRPTRVPKPDPDATPSPTRTPQPTKTPAEKADAALAQHNRQANKPYSPPKYGISDQEIEDHVLKDIPGAIKWLKSRYADETCDELTQFTVFPRRLVWLDEHSTTAWGN